MKVERLALPAVVRIEPDVFRDARGYLYEAWHRARYEAAGLPGSFSQDGLSRPGAGVLRGPRLQTPNTQGKLAAAIQGEILDVAVDVRRGSPTFGRWVSARLSAENAHQLYVPVGFAEGFCVVRAPAMCLYKCTEPYDPAAELGVRWDDSDLGIDWPVAAPL